MLENIAIIAIMIIFAAAIVYISVRSEKAAKARRLAEEAAIAEREADFQRQRAEKEEALRQSLMSKYNDETIVEKLVKKQLFVGETAEMLIDSFGPPVSKDERVLKTKTKEIWKYDLIGMNQYGTRITLEDGSVVGWDKKDRY